MSKFSQYYEQILNAEKFPLHIKCSCNKDAVVQSLRLFVRRKKLPYKIRRRLEIIEVLKKENE